jgi:hypothetical protein
MESILYPIATSLSGYITYKNAYVDDIPTCDDYAKNTYLYTLTSLLLFWTFWVYMSKSEQLLNYNLKIYGNLFIFFGILISQILFISYLRSINPDNIIQKHVALIVFLASFAFMTVIGYIILKPLLLYGVIGASIIAFVTYRIIKQYPNLVDKHTQKKVSMGLIALIILSVFGIFFVKDPATLYLLICVLTVASIAIMTLNLLVHHRLIDENEENCVSPDYINESLGVFMTLINLIMDIARLIKLVKRK